MLATLESEKLARKLKTGTDHPSEPPAGPSDLWDKLNQEIIGCAGCPRLLQHCTRVATEKRRAYADEVYWGKPVPNFFSPAPADGAATNPERAVLIVGLAPGAHGANRTGRMFTGDRSGDWLYRALYRGGLANQAASVHRSDSLELIDTVITAVCHCAPPDNRPRPEEISQCQPFLLRSLELCRPRVILALGKVAWDAVQRLSQRHPTAFQREAGHALSSHLAPTRNLASPKNLTSTSNSKPKSPGFAHGAVAVLGDIPLVGCYHPSQQNTFTKRLTEVMLDEVISKVVGFAR